LNKRNSFSLLIVAIAISLFSIIFYISRQWGNLKLNQSLSDHHKLIFLIHASGTNDEYLFSVWIQMYPKDRKIGLYFINPLAKFSDEDEPLYRMKSAAKKVVAKQMSAISGRSPNFIINIGPDAFIKMVDLAGGIPIFLDPGSAISSETFQRNVNDCYIMNGEDAYDYLTTLSSKEAISYVRRLERQESALLAYFFHIKKQKDLLKKQYFPILSSWVDSNLQAEEWINLTEFLLNQDIEFGVGELPGEIQSSSKQEEYILKISPDTAKIAYKKFEADILSEFFSDTERARVEVLNGTNINGLAKKGKSLLNERRIKVLTVENAWKDNFKTSVILNRSGNTKISKKISDAIASDDIYFSIRKEYGLDATLILGEDFAKKN